MASLASLGLPSLNLLTWWCLPTSLMLLSFQGKCPLLLFFTWTVPPLSSAIQVRFYSLSQCWLAMACPLSFHSFLRILLEWFSPHSVPICYLVPYDPHCPGSSSRVQTVCCSSWSPRCLLKVGHIKDTSVLLRWLAWSLEHQYLFVSVKGSTRVGGASRDIGVGRRFRDLETQKTWLLSLKTIMSLGCRVLLFMK